MGNADARINMRVSEKVRDMIDRAAELQGVDRTAFMLDAATTRARNVILEDRILMLTPREVEQVRDLLDSVPQPTAELARAAHRLAELGL